MRFRGRGKAAVAFASQGVHLGGDGRVRVEGGGLDDVAVEDGGGGEGPGGEGLEFGFGVGGGGAALVVAGDFFAGAVAEAAEFVFVGEEGGIIVVVFVAVVVVFAG